MSLAALAEYVTILEQLYRLRQRPRTDARADGKLRTAMKKLREDLTLSERLAADRRGLQLNRAFRQWLAAQPEESVARRPPKDETVGGRARPEPASSLPGSRERVRELERRRRHGLELFSDADLDEDERHGLEAEPVRNGAAKVNRTEGMRVVRDGGATAVPTAAAPHSFAARLRRLREERGYSRKRLARRAGVTLRCVSLWERGERRPTWEPLCRVARALGVPLDALQGGRG